VVPANCKPAPVRSGVPARAGMGCPVVREARWAIHKRRVKSMRPAAGKSERMRGHGLDKNPDGARAPPGFSNGSPDVLPAVVEAGLATAAVARLHRLGLVDRQRAAVDLLAAERRHRG